MDIFNGIVYNFRGLGLGLKTPKLLILGFVRFATIIVFTLVSAGFILAYHQEILSLIWTKPESLWILWLWHLLSWAQANRAWTRIFFKDLLPNPRFYSSDKHKSMRAHDNKLLSIFKKGRKRVSFEGILKHTCSGQ